jgi:hypothetical protein
MDKTRPSYLATIAVYPRLSALSRRPLLNAFFRGRLLLSGRMTRSAPLLYTPAMAISAAVMAAIVLAGFTAAQESVSFSTQDGGLVYADVYGKGDRGVVLAHGGGLTKDSWEKQGRALAEAGFRSLALDFRGEGQSRGGGADAPG